MSLNHRLDHHVDGQSGELDRQKENEGASSDSLWKAGKKSQSQSEKTASKGKTNQKCPECGSDLVDEGGEVVCAGCNVVVADSVIDPGPEWRRFPDEEETVTRCGDPVTKRLHDKGLSTVMGETSKDAKGNTISQDKQRKFNRLRKQDKWAKFSDSTDRSLTYGLGEIKRIGSEINLSESITETASVTYHKVTDNGLLPGRSVEAMVSATLFIAIRQHQSPVQIDRLVSVSRVDKSEITSAYRYICNELGIEIEPPKLEAYFNSAVTQIDVNVETEKKAQELLEACIDESKHSGKSPMGLAVSAIYSAAMITQKDVLSQQEVAEIGDISVVTLRNRSKELLSISGYDYNELQKPKGIEL